MDQGVQESTLRKTLDNKALWPYGHGSSLPPLRECSKLEMEGSRISEFPTKKELTIHTGRARVLSSNPGKLMLLRKHLQKE